MIESLSTRLSPSVPLPVPVDAVTVNVELAPDGVTDVITGVPPSPPLRSVKSEESTPLTLVLKVTFHDTEADDAGLDEARLTDRTTGATRKVPFAASVSCAAPLHTVVLTNCVVVTVIDEAPDGVDPSVETVTVTLPVESVFPSVMQEDDQLVPAGMPTTFVTAIGAGSLRRRFHPLW